MPIIDLTSTEDRRGAVVLIDAEGIEHFYIDPDEQTLRQKAEMRRITVRLEQLEGMQAPTKGHEAEYVKLLGELVRMVLPTIPQSALEGLTAVERGALYTGFLVHTGAQSSMNRALTWHQLTGTTSFPASSGSTRRRTRTRG